jgi:hypothetical protein
MISLSHWYGRLGNNIQQCAVGTLWAEETHSSFESIDHEIIKKYKRSFGENRFDLSSKCFYWQGPYQEVNLPVETIYKNMRRVCKKWIYPQLDIQPTEVPDDTLVIHIRSGDIFDKNVPNPERYVPNPYHFYTTLLKSFEKAIVVTEDDDYNPIVEELSYHRKVTIQRGTVAKDFATLLGAKHVANSGVGTFAVAAALCSHNIEHFYCSDLSDTEHLNWKMLVDSDVKVHQMHLPHYLLPGEWRNTDEQREFILTYEASLS